MKNGIRNTILNVSFVAMLCLVSILSACTKNPEGSISVTTKNVTDITENSAKCGGSVTSTGFSVGDCGVCYSESSSPTINDSFTKDREGTGSFISTLSNLKSGTTYYVRAYAKTSSGVEYGDEKTFKTLGNGSGGGDSGSGYTINVFADPTAGGTVTGAGTYQEGQSCTVTAIVNTGYTFTSWTENGTVVSNNESYCFTVSGNRNLTANFSQNSYSIAVSVAPENSGTVTGIGNYNHGQSCTLVATANSGYAFTNWTEDGEVVSNNASYTFSATGNRALVANFEIQTYTISITANPSNGGSVSGGGNEFHYGQSCSVTAMANSDFTFTKWTENGSVVSTDASYTFVVSSDRNLVAHFEGTFNGHGYVDLGLPSGTLWATCNVGATTSEGYGDFFAWGETSTKATYTWSTYKYCHNGNYNQLTKYCNNSWYGYNGFIDNLTALQLSDDAATINWGNGWCTPTISQWEELLQNTTYILTTLNGINGILFTANNGNNLFLPESGHPETNFQVFGIGYEGSYWSNSLSTNSPDGAMCLRLYTDFYDTVGITRYGGACVRPVRSFR